MGANLYDYDVFCSKLQEKTKWSSRTALGHNYFQDASSERLTEKKITRSISGVLDVPLGYHDYLFLHTDLETEAKSFLLSLSCEQASKSLFFFQTN